MPRLTTSQLRREYGPTCLKGGKRFTFWNGTPITVHPATVEAWAALDSILRAHNYAPKRGETGSYNCRKITGGSGYSLHAFGIAADINWNSGPYRKRPATAPDCAGLWKHGLTDMPCDMVDQIKRIKTNTGVEVFRWGGDYTRNVDAMHWEVVCAKSDLASGIDASSVDARPFDPTDPTMRPVVKRGSAKSFHVENVQTAVGATVDGAFGPGTEAKVKAWQAKMGLKADGVFDLDDWQTLLGAKPKAQPAPAAEKPATQVKDEEGEALTPAEIAFVKGLYAEAVKWDAKPSSLFHVLRWFRAARKRPAADRAHDDFYSNY